MIYRECFLSQFPNEVDISDIKDRLIPSDRPDLEMQYGIKIYRFFDMLVIENNGQYFTNR